MMWWRVGWLGDLPVQIIMLYSLLVDVQTVYLFVRYAHLKHVPRGILFPNEHILHGMMLMLRRFIHITHGAWVRGEKG